MVKASIIPSANGFGIIWVDKIVRRNSEKRERLEILLLESMPMGIISWVYGELIYRAIIDEVHVHVQHTRMNCWYHFVGELMEFIITKFFSMEIYFDLREQ